MRGLHLFLLLVILSIACRAVMPGQTPIQEAPTSPVMTATPVQRASTAIPPGELAREVKLTPSSLEIILHPDGRLFVGDQVSIEILAPPGDNLEEQRVQVSLEQGVEDEEIGTAEFGFFGIGHRPQATLSWAWDTTDLAAGEYTLNFNLLPRGIEWQENVTLLPRSALPQNEQGAHWTTAENDCCLVYYVTGSDAERDLDDLLVTLDKQAEDAISRMQVGFDDPVEIIFLPRVLGHGGFAGGEIAISYLDRNYAGGGADIVIHHELVHILDQRLGGFRPSVLAEGLAVYLSGGHFKQEALLERAAALVPAQTGCSQASEALANPASAHDQKICSLDQYIEFRELVDHFYLTQHEIGYLQAGALVEFMVQEWGWGAFRQFYLSIEFQPEADEDFPRPGGSDWRAFDAALQEHFGITLPELERRFRDELSRQELRPEWVEDVRLTVAYYDTMRRYQQILDPSAYFLTAWLVDTRAMLERGIVADYLRHPQAPENIALEELLVGANEALFAGDTQRAERLLGVVNAALDVLAEDQAPVPGTLGH